MKREYQKPEIVFESFALSTNIAASCAIDADQASRGSCGYLLPGVGVVFNSNLTGCVVKVRADKGVGNELCYHVPTETKALFNS